MGRRKRRGRERTIGKCLHILFEDKKSSRFYIKGYKTYYHYHDNIILEPHSHTDPKSLVENAKKLKTKFPDDEIWVVYDAESPRQRAVSTEHAPAWQNATDSGIKIAISSVSYETWILLHYQYSTRQFDESDDLESYIKHNFQVDYDKADENIFITLRGQLVTAKKNADRLEQHNTAVNSGQKAYAINPYTDFHKLLAAIDKFNKEN